ncbi:MAG: lipid A biosynthesis acyltransferase [Limnohabitans sp.]|nr:lipid A biosynthesis acyltransferase [Limnohabitans sp.]
MISRLGVAWMWLLHFLPLRVLRFLGAVLGLLLYAVVWGRRRVVTTNLKICFPQWNQQQNRQCARQHFIYFAQAWLDRSWLWIGSPELIRQRVELNGAQELIQNIQPTVVFAPHFVGLDVGWMALCMNQKQPMYTIYTPQADAVVDAWITQGRQRFGDVHLFSRKEGAQAIVSQLRKNGLLYLLPDMNYAQDESIFVPFYGVMAATVPSLSRFAKLGRALVVPVVSRMTDRGYVVQVLPAWLNYPTDDVHADTQLMNERLQAWIDDMPAQYFWVHQRFKSRPEGETSLYGGKRL